MDIDKAVKAAIDAGALQPQHTCSVEGNQSPLLSSLGPHFDYNGQCASDGEIVLRNVAGERRAVSQARAALHHAVLAASDNEELLLLLHYPPFHALALHTLDTCQKTEESEWQADAGCSRSEEYRQLRELPVAEHMGAEAFLSFQAKGCWKQMNLSVVKNIMVKDEYFEHAIAVEVEVDSEDSADVESVWLAKKRYTEFKELFQKLQKLLPNLGLEIPGRTFVPGKWKRPETVAKRQIAFDKFLNDVLDWVKNHVDNEDDQELTSEVVDLMTDFLGDPKPRVRKPVMNSTQFSPPTLSAGWLRKLAFPSGIEEISKASTDVVVPEEDIHFGFECVNCEALTFLCEGNKAIRGLHLQGACEGSVASSGLAPLLEHLCHQECGLFRLSLGRFKLSKHIDDVLEEAFTHNQSLLSLSFVGGFCGVGLRQPGSLLRALMIPSLQSLNLSGALGGAPLHAEHLQLITDWLEGAGQLRKLWLDSNHVGDEGAKNIAVALAANSTLEVLSLRQSQVSPNGLIELFNSLKHNGALRVLHVVDRPFSLPLGAASVKDVAESCADMLSANRTLEELDLTGQYLSDHILKLAAALKGNSALQRLVVGNNRFFAGPVLDALLCSSCELRSLDVSSNDLMEEGEVLPENWLENIGSAQFLSELHLPWLNNEIFVGPLLTAVAKLPALKKLVLGGPVSKAREGVLASLLGSCEHLEILHLQSGDRGAFGLHDAILHAPSLHAIHWHLSCSEATAFLDRLEACESRKITRLLFSFEEAGMHHDIYARVDSLLGKPVSP